MREPIKVKGKGRMWLAGATFCFACAAFAAQQPAAPAQQPQTAAPQAAQPSDKATPKAQTRITPEQAQQLFGLVDDLLQFSSQETGLPVQGTVKRQLTTRAAVEDYLTEKLNEDQDAKRMQQSEIVLKKFGMLDRDFDLKPFLISLLKEQIEAYYDAKTKTVNLLDWIAPDEQKPVLAHELTHALQDQHINLDTWSDQTPPDVSLNSAGDTVHLAKDEIDTARQAVLEGQATAVMMDNILKPMGRSLIKNPEVVEFIKQQMVGSDSSPIMARAPILLSESLMFPYREGLSFEQDVWMDKGREAAFTGTLDRPPTSSWEIINPREYEKGRVPTIPFMPDIHPLVDKLYRPYDIGQIGQLDVHILTSILGGDDAARDLSPAWDGGIYWAGQLRSATLAEQASTKSIAFFYLSVWKSPASARSFARLYADNLGRKYSGLKADHGDPQDAPSDSSNQQVFTTNEGTVVITTRGKMVFVSESFPLGLARELTALLFDAQGTGELKLAATRPSGSRAPSSRLVAGAGLESREAPSPDTGEPLSASFVRFFSRCGVMKAAVDAALQAAQ